MDEFVHPKTKKKSMCFRLVYRHPEKQLTRDEIREVHGNIELLVQQNFNVILR